VLLERGDVGWAVLPAIGRKPVVVVSTRVVALALRPIVARIASIERDRPLPTAVALIDGEISGLPSHSWVVCHDLATLVVDVPLEPLGPLSPGRMLEVEDALRAALSL
jgi:mRNA-degrading endonuclease toxin of MazEF toxin-antitoxin module